MKASALILILSLFWPVSSFACNITIPNEFAYSNRDDWDRVVTAIQNCKDKVIHIYSEGVGGYTDVADPYINALLTYKRHGGYIVYHLQGESASMHAYASCTADEWTGDGRLMFHAVRDLLGHIYYPLTYQYLDLCKAHISKWTRQKVIEGYDVWINHPKH